MTDEHCLGCVAYQWVCGSMTCTDLVSWPSAVPKNPPCFKSTGRQIDERNRGIVIQFPGERK